jgi:hypothetical protein
MDSQIWQYDENGEKQKLDITLTSYENKRPRLNIYISFFYKDGSAIGHSSLNFVIINDKVMWVQPTWLKQSTMDYCNKLVKMKAFV